MMHGAAQHLEQYISSCVAPLCPFQEAAPQDLDQSFNLILIGSFSAYILISPDTSPNFTT